MLEFLATTDVGRRLMAQDQEQKKRRKRKDETWRLNKVWLEGGEKEWKGNKERGGQESEEGEGTTRV